AATDQTPTTLAALSRLLEEDLRRGYAVSTSFYERGVTEVAAPVRDRSGRVVASINAVTVEGALDERYVRGELKDQLLAAAASISAMLGAPNAPAQRFGT